MKKRFFVIVAAFGLVAVAAPVGALVYQYPVVGTVTDGFRPPSNQYGSGNRGWQYQTASGSRVLAAADGKVVFASQVAGVLYVVIAHDDGVLTTYGQFSGIAVKVGDQVAHGQQIGSTTSGFYFGARKGGSYVDPAGLFDARVRLVPNHPSASTAGAN